jgi:hypothetical protein
VLGFGCLMQCLGRGWGGVLQVVVKGGGRNGTGGRGRRGRVG